MTTTASSSIAHTRPEPRQRLRLPLFLLLLLAGALLLPGTGAAGLGLAPPPPPPPPPAAPTILFSNSGAAIAILEIGTDLDIGLTAGSPNATYRVSLEDESGVEIIVQTIQTDAQGAASAPVFWQRTGIVGCDPWQAPVPLDYLYANLLQAEALLDGRNFEVVVSASGQALVRRLLPLAKGIPQPFAYLSDAVACERNVYFEYESLSTSFAHVPLGTDLPIWVFVVDHQASWTAGDPLVDVSSDGPNFGIVFGGGPTTIFDIGTVPGPGYYDVIVRYGYSQNLVFDPLTDSVPGASLPAMDAKSYQPCGIHCPPPPPPPQGG